MLVIPLRPSQVMCSFDHTQNIHTNVTKHTQKFLHGIDSSM